MPKQHITIAIDGPSGAGKSSMARAVAERFGLMYVDTGAIYRTVALAVKRAGINTKDTAGVLNLLPSLDIRVAYDAGGVQHMFLQGEDVSAELRTPEISRYTSDVSTMPGVRAFLLEMQRAFARENSVVMDGRDIGTVVLPDADLKIFLTASPEDRARRRFEELRAQGADISYDEVFRDLLSRDKNDSERGAAPLKAAEGATLLNTTGNTAEQSRALIFQIIAGRFGL